MDDVPRSVISADSLAAAQGNRRIQPFDVELGARIRALRVAAGMSQAALGQIGKFSFQQEQKYETGKDRLSAATLFKFATALNFSVRSFFEGAPQYAPSKPARSDAGNTLSARIIIPFQQIDDLGIRKHLVALATVLADVPGPNAPGTLDEDPDP